METPVPAWLRRRATNRSERPAHAWAADVGPGLATVAADNDPSGLLTYSLAGARYGFDLLWVCVLSYPSMVALQLISARVAAVTGKGLTENMREHYSRWLFLLAVARFLVANTLNIAADMLAMGEGAKLIFGGSVGLFAMVFGGTSLVLQWSVPYVRYAGILKWLSLTLFCYAATLLFADVPWRTVAWRAVVPDLQWSEEFFAMLLAVLGTTVSPYLLFSQAEQEVEERSHEGSPPNRENARTPETSQLRKIRRQTVARTLLSNAASAVVMIASAATLHVTQQPLRTARDAAGVLEPAAHGYAPIVLGLALLGTALLALPPLTGSAAHAAASSFGWPQGEARDRRIGLVMIGLMVVGAMLAWLLLAFKVDPLTACYWTALTNGMTVTPVLILLVLLSSHRDAVGSMKAHWFPRALCWIATLATGAALAAHALLEFAGKVMGKFG